MSFLSASSCMAACSNAAKYACRVIWVAAPVPELVPIVICARNGSFLRARPLIPCKHTAAHALLFEKMPQATE